MEYYARALELKEEIIANRRYLHTNAEVGLELPKAVAYVCEKLKEAGIEPQLCGHGVTATIGKGGKCILLRADMDALPMAEESGEEFACPTGEAAHQCGHDFHAAMLLGAAKMLKENEDALEGTVKLMFQPAEEIFMGSKDMVEAGILENPKVDAAIGYHVSSGMMPVGIYMYNNRTTMMFSADGFKVTVCGRSAHGAYPHNSIDPINIGVHVYLALEALIAREADPAKSCVVTVGQFHAGTAANQIPDTAVMEGTMRTNDNGQRDLLRRRIQEVAEKTAEVYGGTAFVEFPYGVPPLKCDPKLTDEVVGYMQAAGLPGAMPYPGVEASASEDFAVIAEAVPTTFMYLSAGYLDERGKYPAHNPKARFNEDVCPVGATYLAHCATEWLRNNK